MLTIRASVFCHLSVSAPTGRTYVHSDEKTACASCPPVPVGLADTDTSIPCGVTQVFAPWTADCETSKHERKRTYTSDVSEPNPAEAKRAANLAGDVRRKLINCASFNGGAGRLFVAPERVEAFHTELGKLRQLIAQTNLEMSSARVEISALFGKLDPSAAASGDTASKESLNAAREAIDAGIVKILEAIKSGDTGTMREVVRETKMLASMLDGDAKNLATETGNFLARAADRLRDATKLGEQHVAVAVEEARKGAARFGSLWAEMGLETGAAPAPEFTTTKVAAVAFPTAALVTGDGDDGDGDGDGVGETASVSLVPLKPGDMDAAGAV